MPESKKLVEVVLVRLPVIFEIEVSFFASAEGWGLESLAADSS